jgi:PIN domain-containing protein
MSGTYEFGTDMPDEEWIRRLAEDRPSDWIVITADKRIAKNKAERAAWVKATLKGFVFAPGLRKSPVHKQASLLLWQWPAFISKASVGAIFELPNSRGGKFRPLPV